MENECLDRAFAAGALQTKVGTEKAFAELWKAAVGQRAQAPPSACAQSIAGAWTVTAATGRVPQENKAEIAFLSKIRQRHWRCKTLENHCAAQSHWQGLV